MGVARSIAPIAVAFLLFGVGLPVNGETDDSRIGTEALGEWAVPSDEVVLAVGDQRLTASQVYRMVDLAAPGLIEDIVADEVLSMLARLEAEMHGIDVSLKAVEEGVAASLAEQRMRFALEVTEEISLADFLEKRHHMSPTEHEEELRRRVLTNLLLDRAVRFDQMHTDREELQIILVEEEELAKEIWGKLEKGASFAVLAGRHSLHPTAAKGGFLPPFPVEGEIPLLVGRSDLEPGDLAVPLSVGWGGREQWRILRLVDRMPARNVLWQDGREEIERELLARPVLADELKVFEERMVARYGVVRPSSEP